MKAPEREAHWQNIYQTKDSRKVSWYQAKPEASLEWIASLKLEKEDAILDVGAGDSRLADFLLDEGYQNLSLLDISEEALKLAQHRLKEKAELAQWLNSDILDFKSPQDYKLWHDRAAFHFLREDAAIQKYVQIAADSIMHKGYLILATFSDNGPLKCSGLEIQRYDELQLIDRFNQHFELRDHQRVQHQTPSGGTQEFLYALFQRNA